MVVDHSRQQPLSLSSPHQRYSSGQHQLPPRLPPRGPYLVHTHTHTHTFRSVRQGSGLTRDGWEGSGSPPRSWRWPLWRACWPSEHLLVCQLHSRPESRAESGQSSPSAALGSALTAGRLHQELLQQSHQNNYGHFPHQQLPAQAAEVRHSSAAWKPRLKDSQHIQPLTQLYMDNGHLTIHSHNGQYCMDTTSKQQAKV